MLKLLRIIYPPNKLHKGRPILNVLKNKLELVFQRSGQVFVSEVHVSSEDQSADPTLSFLELQCVL